MIPRDLCWVGRSVCVFLVLFATQACGTLQNAQEAHDERERQKRELPAILENAGEYNQQGKYQEAAQLFGGVLGKPGMTSGQTAEAHLGFAIALEGLDEQCAAAKNYRQAEMQSRNWPQFPQQVAREGGQRTQEQCPSPGAFAFLRGQYDVALVLLTDERRIGVAHAIVYLGLLEERAGRPCEASFLYATALRGGRPGSKNDGLNGKRPLAQEGATRTVCTHEQYASLAKKRRQIGKIREARDLYRQAMEADKSQDQYLLAIARMYALKPNNKEYNPCVSKRVLKEYSQRVAPSLFTAELKTFLAYVKGECDAVIREEKKQEPGEDFWRK